MDDIQIDIIDKTNVTSEPVWHFLFHRLPHDPIYHIFSFATFSELCTFSIVSSEWNKIITLNNRLWINLCQSFWSNKYVPSQYRNLIKGPITVDEKKEAKLSSECIGRKAFRLAYIDRSRTTLTVDELTGFKWYFRFKKQAGETWLNMDPFWNLNDDDFDQSTDETKMNWDEEDDTKQTESELLKYKPSELVGIMTDDEIEEYKLKQLRYQQTMRQNSLQHLKEKKVLTEHEKRLLRCTRIKFHRDGGMDFLQNRKMNDMINTQSFEWRFSGSFCKDRLYGNALAVNSYPRKYMSRHPKNWGFIMQSCWVIYTSFPMPMVGSTDDELINDDDFNIRGYAEMIQYNYMGGVRHRNEGNGNGGDEVEDDDKLMNENGNIDLEYLKGLKQQQVSDDGDFMNGQDDADMQHAISQFLMQRWNINGYADTE